jgi:photosystem II stability/assembly factor-like uncharacterized protein
MADESLKTSQASLWIQPDGANTEVFFLGCHDLDDVSAPEGGTELVRCQKPDGSGWNVAAVLKSPPDPITTTITTLLYKQRDWIEKVRNCPFNLYVLFRECGRADVFANNVRGLILAGARIAGRTYGQLVNREDLASTVAAEIEAVPPLLQVVDLTAERIVVATVTDINDIVADMSARCYGNCGAAQDPGDLAMYVTDALAAVTAAFSVRTVDEGQTWTASAAAPYGVGVANSLQTGIRVQLDRNTFRLVVGRLWAAGAGSMSYSDDNGATWTAVALPNGTGAVAGGSLILVGKNLWLASAGGYVFKSIDYGETWTAMTAGTLTVQNLYQISFADDLNGMAVGAAGAVLKTVDGGLTWSLATVPVAAILNCVKMLDAKRAWVGSANGNIYFTTDGGTTWTVRIGWPGAGVAGIGVMDIDFLNDLEGIMVSNTAAPVGTILRTINGGLDWQTITTPTNVGLTCCAFAREDLAFVGGLLSVTSMVIKVRAA